MGQPRWPLILLRCELCHLVQLDDPAPDEPDADAIQQSHSTTLAEHARAFAREAVELLPADRHGTVISLASHGGHLAPYLAELGVGALVLDRSATLVASARQRGARAEAVGMTPRGIAKVVSAYGRADLVLDSYLLAHLRDTDAGVAALAALLAPAGIAVVEFDNVVSTLVSGQYDAVRHGHFAYFSLTSLASALERNGLRALHADPYPVYGGALRVRVGMAEGPHLPDSSVVSTLRAEQGAGVRHAALYAAFTARVDRERAELRHHLEAVRSAGRRIAGYGAPSRGNTLLGAAGIGPDLLPYTVDVSAAKHGRLMSTDVPIVPIDRIDSDRPDEIVILTWDIADEVMSQLDRIRAWGARFVIPIPTLTVR